MEVDVDLAMSSDCDSKNYHGYCDDFDTCLNCNMDGVASCSYNSSAEQLQRYHSHSKKVIKHALRQQAKRRRKNTTIASGNTNVLPRIIVKTLPPKPPEEMIDGSPKASTMKEVLASIPGFSIKPRKRSNKKLSTAAQLEQTKEGCIDLETPDSILVNTNIRALLNKHTFASLPSLYQHKLVQLLPNVDRPKLADHSSKLTTSGLNNEFFARACLEWRERLSEGEFTPENQQKLKSEAEKDKSKLDPWKLKHFEPIWGDKSQNGDNIHSIIVPNGPTRPALKTTIKLRPSTSICKHSKSSSVVKKQRLRTVGAVTRAITSYREENCTLEDTCSSPAQSLSDKEVKFQTEIPRPEIVLSQIHSSDSRESDIEAEKEEVDPLQITDPLVETEITDAPLADVIVADIVHSHSAKRSRSNSPMEINPKRHSPDPYPCSEVLFSLKCDSPDVSNLSEKEITPDKENDPYFEQSIDSVSTKDTSISCDPDILTKEDCDLIPDKVGSVKSLDNCDSLDMKIEHDEFPENIPSQESINDFSYDSSNNMKYESTASEEADSISDLKSMDCQIDSKSQESDDNDHLTSGMEVEDLHSGLIQGTKLPSSLILQQETLMIEKDCSEVYGEQTFEKLEASVKESDLVTFSQSVALNADDEADEANEDRFIDAENFVLESGAISSPDLQNVDKFVQDNSAAGEDVSKSCVIGEDMEADAEEMQAALFAAAVARGEDCCWDVVDSSTEKLLADVVPLHALDAVSVPASMASLGEEPNNDVKVIPMQEELEVRLEEGSFQVGCEWPYVFKMDQDIMTAAIVDSDSHPDTLKTSSKLSDLKSEFANYQPTGNQVKLELEVTLTPEAVHSDSMVTSTKTSSSTTTPSLNKNIITTVIPPTTIVCLPSVVATSTNLQMNQLPATNMVRTALVATSSAAVPYLTLSTSTPMRPLPLQKPKPKQISQVASGSSGANRNRGSANKPPPGAVNLERSYQICQAVIQNSPNRDQLRCQLKPPPSLLAAQNPTAVSNNTPKKSATQYSAVSSSRTANKVFSAPHQVPPTTVSANNVTVKSPLVLTNPSKMLTNARLGQRQQSPPVVVRHVFTSNQGIPVTMAVLPQSQGTDIVETPPPGSLGQYILVQRAEMGDSQNTPRASSAPPQQVAALGGVAGQSLVVGTACNRLRPASVDMEPRPPAMLYGSAHGPHPGTQAISKREKLYGDISMDNYAIVADNIVTPASQIALQKNIRPNLIVPRSDAACACNLKAMIVCKNCGAFCHDDCIGPSRLCVTCLIR